MSNQNDPFWLAWVVPVITAGGVAVASLRRLFVSVTRQELAEILDKAEASRTQQRQDMHRENLDKFDELFERLGHVEKDVSFLRGQRSNR